MTDNSEIKNWKNVGTFDTFQEANELRDNLKDSFGEDIQVKIKRCGHAGLRYQVKTYYGA